MRSVYRPAGGQLARTADPWVGPHSVGVLPHPALRTGAPVGPSVPWPASGGGVSVPPPPVFPPVPALPPVPAALPPDPGFPPAPAPPTPTAPPVPAFPPVPGAPPLPCAPPEPPVIPAPPLPEWPPVPELSEPETQAAATKARAKARATGIVALSRRRIA